MCHDYAAADRQAKAGASSISLFGIVYLVKAVKYLLAEFRGNTIAFIGHADSDILAVRTGLEHDSGTFRRILRRILNQIGKDLADTVIINQNWWQTGRNVNLERVFGCQVIQSAASTNVYAAS